MYEGAKTSLKNLSLMKKINRIVMLCFLFISTICKSQNTLPNIEGYEFKSIDERISLLDSIISNDYSNNLYDVFYCIEDLKSITGVQFDINSIDLTGDDARVFIINKSKYDEYLRKLRFVSEKIREVIRVQIDSDSLVVPSNTSPDDK